MHKIGDANYPMLAPKTVRRRANRAFIAGGILFGIAAWVGSMLAGSKEHFTHSAYLLLLVPPIGLISYAPWLGR